MSPKADLGDYKTSEVSTEYSKKPGKPDAIASNKPLNRKELIFLAVQLWPLASMLADGHCFTVVV